MEYEQSMKLDRIRKKTEECYLCEKTREVWDIELKKYTVCPLCCE